jgi:hypothetical protein
MDPQPRAVRGVLLRRDREGEVMRIAPTLRDFIENHDWPQYGPHKQRMKELKALLRVARAARDHSFEGSKACPICMALAALDRASGGK